MTSFKPTYWGTEKSVKATFEPIIKILPTKSITSCMVAAFDDGKLLLIKSKKRGWELPGGHREKYERPMSCAKREVLEEASVIISNLQIIGQWKAERIFLSNFNKDYPKVAYQLLFIAKVQNILAFNSDFETTDRKFVHISSINKVHKNYEGFKPILDHISSFV